MKNTVFIYILEDPETQEIRYVGKTKNPKMRFHNHCNNLHNTKSHKRNWINSLRSKNLRPIMRIIDEVEGSEWHFWERYWIQQLKIWGCRLTNHTSGGDGLTLGNETSFKKGHNPKHDTHTYISCEGCKELFKISPSKLGIKKYCSMECYSKFKKGKHFTNSGSFKKGHNPWNKNTSSYTTSKAKTVLQLSLDEVLINKYHSCKEAAISVGCNIENIRRACVGLSKTAKNYIWKYE